MLENSIETISKLEHDRFVAERRCAVWTAAPGMAKASRDDYRLLHNFLFHWTELDEPTKDLDRKPMRAFPKSWLKSATKFTSNEGSG